MARVGEGSVRGEQRFVVRLRDHVEEEVVPVLVEL